MGFFDDVKNTSDNTNLGTSYTYGIDATGQMYIYDQGAGKMVYYGDVSTGSANLYVYKNEGHTVTADKPATTTTAAPPSSTATATGGYVAPPKLLDTAQLGSLDSLLGSYDTVRGQKKQQAVVARDTDLNKKKEEAALEKGKYDGKKLSTLQDFGGAKTDTDLNTRNTLENLMSSLSTMGLGGSRALTRQILDASNMSNRKANATQAKDSQALDSAFNEYTAGNENDVKMIGDQYNSALGDADHEYGQNRQNALYKKADVYNAADGYQADRAAMMKEGDDLTSFIGNSVFMNPNYNGTKKTMATPELGNYTQDIAKYDTTNIGTPGGLTPVGGGAPAGNLAIKAVALNNKDLGVKKKTEGNLGYGV